jgi:hypothetical protein
MKKLVLSLVLGASLAVAPSVFALSSMTDANMKSATGQAGVSIAIDDVVIETYVGSTSYIDEDGTEAGGGNAGAIEITDRHTLKTYQALTSAADFAADFTAGTTLTGVLGTWKAAHSLSIDIGTCAVLSKGLSQNYLGADTGVVVTGVTIGLPTLCITTSGDEYSIKASMTGANNSGESYITIRTTGSKLAILGGTLEIAPHTDPM